MPELIAIGALNLDYIATRQSQILVSRQQIEVIKQEFEAGSERVVDIGEIRTTISQMGDSVFETFLGGSAFNAIRALRSLNHNFGLGYVGIAGACLDPRHDFARWFETNNVESRFVQNQQVVASGACISFILDGERYLLTYPGANTGMAAYLRRHYRRLRDYIAAAHIVHVTSFFDAGTPLVLSSLLKDAKNKNPGLKISFHPGNVWLESASSAIQHLIAMASILFLNEAEFRLLGHYRPGDNDQIMAQRVFNRYGHDGLLVVMRQHDAISTFQSVRGRILVQHYAGRAIPQEIIQDTTGAGGVFAAGVIGSILTPGMELNQGMELGLRLVRTKLIDAGSYSFDSFPRIFDIYIDELCSRSRVSRASVFIGHGRSQTWRIVATHLTGKYGIRVKSFESETRVGEQVTEVLTECLEECAFAILILTAEDETQDGKLRARQNVIHEVGLFQGRHGFRRVVLLVQEGIEKASNIDGLQYISFPQDKVEWTFPELDRVLIREHVIPSPDSQYVE